MNKSNESNDASVDMGTEKHVLTLAEMIYRSFEEGEDSLAMESLHSQFAGACLGMPDKAADPLDLHEGSSSITLSGVDSTEILDLQKSESGELRNVPSQMRIPQEPTGSEASARTPRSLVQKVETTSTRQRSLSTSRLDLAPSMHRISRSVSCDQPSTEGLIDLDEMPVTSSSFCSSQLK